MFQFRVESGDLLCVASGQDPKQAALSAIADYSGDLGTLTMVGKKGDELFFNTEDLLSQLKISFRSKMRLV